MSLFALCQAATPPCLQLHTSLDSNKTEKHHKEAFRLFFAAAGFEHVNSGADLKLSSAAVVSNASMREHGGTGGGVSERDAVQWPDLYDVNIEP